MQRHQDSLSTGPHGCRCATGSTCMRALHEPPVVPIRRRDRVLIYRNKLDADPKSHASCTSSWPGKRGGSRVVTNADQDAMDAGSGAREFSCGRTALMRTAK